MRITICKHVYLKTWKEAVEYIGKGEKITRKKLISF